MKIAFIGLGIMGLPMAENLAKKYPLIGYDIVAKTTPFPFAHSYQEALEGADVVFTMLPKSEHVLMAYREIRNYLKPGMIAVDMSTIAPKASLAVANDLLSLQVPLLDCPVVKSQAAAIKGELGIYVGGEKAVYEQVRPLLECLGKNIIYMGPNGAGLRMKILHNALVGEIQNGVNEVLGMAETMGLSLEEVVKALGYGGAQCFYLDSKATNIEKKTYPTAFSVENMAKDIHFAQELAHENHLDCPGIDNVVRVYEEAMNAGLAKEDFSASYKIVHRE